MGRHAAEAAVTRGHRVTLLHRGVTGPGAIDGAEEILLDRTGDLSEVAAQEWDVVIDSCGYVPRVVRHSAEALKNSVDHYLFVSTISVYSPDGEGRLVIRDQPPLETEEITGETYGPLKVECENVVREVYGDRSAMLRAGILAGPFDPTNRFTYWVTRIAEGGDVLVTDWPDQPLQLIDARDLAEFQILIAEQRLSGALNAAGEAITFGQMLDFLLESGGNSPTRLVQAPAETLAGQGIAYWTDIPLTFSKDEGLGALMRADSSEAVALGLRRRPLSETAADTLAWARQYPATNPQHGLSREREAKAIAALNSPAQTA